MKLSRKTISTLGDEISSKPAENIFQLPEKILQFGTGVLLRGLPDYYIDKANKQGIFNGRIVVVKSTSNGGTDAFDLQDGLYTHCIKGIRDQKVVEEYILNASISRVLNANEEWKKILELAHSEDMQIIISNTTESGMVMDKNDKINKRPPTSFPGKLLAFLFERWKFFGGSAESGMVIVPTELISDNGNLLKTMVNGLAVLNNLDNDFIEWLGKHNHFCNSLVDRIVPGKLPAAPQKQMQAMLGYEDELMIMSEVYSLWAIETDNDRVKQCLSFAEADDTVILTADIFKYKELKLRLLNGTHSFSCALAFLAGFETVKEAMQDGNMKNYIGQLMHDEITPAIVSDLITEKAAHNFSGEVIDRFANPHIEHKWLSIAMNYTGKMQMRNVEIILKHYNTGAETPGLMALGFAAYLRFMQPVKEDNGKFYGAFEDRTYLIDDPKAEYFKTAWSDANPVKRILSDSNLWKTNLAVLPGFEAMVNEFLKKIDDSKLMEVLSNLLATNKPRATA